MADRLCPYNPSHGYFSDEDLPDHLREEHGPEVIRGAGKKLDEGEAEARPARKCGCGDASNTDDDGQYCCRYGCPGRCWRDKESRDIHEQTEHLNDAVEIVIDTSE